MAVLIDLWSCLLTTKLSYAQLLKWGHSTEDQIHSIEELQKIAIGFGFHGRPRQYIRYIIKDSAKFRLILKICCHIQKEQTKELRQKINKFEQKDSRQPKRFKSVWLGQMFMC